MSVTTITGPQYFRLFRNVLSAIVILSFLFFTGCPVVDTDNTQNQDDSQSQNDTETGGDWNAIVDSLDFKFDYSWSVYSADNEYHIFGKEPNDNSVMYSSTNNWQPVKPGLYFSKVKKGKALYAYGGYVSDQNAPSAVYSTDGGATFRTLITGEKATSVSAIVPGGDEVDYMFVAINGTQTRCYALSYDDASDTVTTSPHGEQSGSDISSYVLLIPGDDSYEEAVIVVDTDGRLWIIQNYGAKIKILNGLSTDEGPIVMDQYGKTLHILSGGKLYRILISELLNDGTLNGADISTLDSFEGYQNNESLSNMNRLEVHDKTTGSVIIGRSSFSTTGFFTSYTGDGLNYTDSDIVGNGHGFNGSTCVQDICYVFGREMYSSSDGITWTDLDYYEFKGEGDIAWVTALGIHNDQLYVSDSAWDTDLHGSKYPNFYHYNGSSWNYMEGLHRTDGSEYAGAVTSPEGKLYIHSDAPSLDGGIFTIDSSGNSVELLDGMIRALRRTGSTLFASAYNRPETGSTTATYTMYWYNEN